MHPKIRCAVCNKWSGHVIVRHLKEKHPELDVFDYVEKYKTQLASAYGFELLKKHQETLVVDRPRVSKKVSELFNIEEEEDVAANPHRRFTTRSLSVFSEPSIFTPAIDEDYIFPEKALHRILMALALPSRNRLWLHGYAGTGKTQLVMQVAARTNYGLMRINGDANISRRQLVGDWTVRNGETVFQHGVLPNAMREGHILLIDEIDNLNPAVLSILRGVLEDPSTLVLLENGGEVIKAHPDFRVMATANTAGAGDDSGLFLTSRALSVADRQRFSVWCKVDYLSPVVESSMLKKRFPKITDEEIRRFYQVVSSVRQQFITGKLEESFSPRELINWVEKFFLTGDAMLSAEMCFIDRYQSPAVQVAVSELVRAAFDETKEPAPLPVED